MVQKYREESVELSHGKIHIHKWLSEREPTSLFVPVHGLMMSGKSFDRLARLLVEKNSLIVAPDLRGFGRFYFTEDQDKTPVDHERSMNDLVELFSHLKSTYKNIPLIALGESLGAHFVRRLAITHPELINALILSSPCIRPAMFQLSLVPHVFQELVLTSINPAREIDLKPFAHRFLKEEPHNYESFLEDERARKSLDIEEIIKSVRVVKPLKLSEISPDLPVLVFRGEKDIVCKKRSMQKFLDSMKSKRLRIHTLKNSGHLILQSQAVEKEVVDTILSWFKDEIETT